MSFIYDLKIDDLIPDTEQLLRAQGIRNFTAVSDKVLALAEEARRLIKLNAKPRAILANCEILKFSEIYSGSGDNASPAPLESIFPRADNLMLFALTVGSDISDQINKLFNTSDFALGAMLDSAASWAADRATQILEKLIMDEIIINDSDHVDYLALGYSPGYCGWHVSGQKRLFTELNPEQIGISLNDSCLMQPLKSVSGVLVYGPKNIHLFDSNFDFCKDCKTFSCKLRMKDINRKYSV